MNDWPQNMLNLVKEQLALMGRVGASATRTTPTVPLGQASVVRFTTPGYILGLYGQTDQGTAASYADMFMRILINGDEDFVTDGLGGPSSQGFLSAFGGAQNWFPVMRRVNAGDNWVFIFSNGLAGTATGPQVTLAMLNDLDVARMNAASASQGGNT